MFGSDAGGGDGGNLDACFGWNDYCTLDLGTTLLPLAIAVLGSIIIYFVFYFTISSAGSCPFSPASIDQSACMV